MEINILHTAYITQTTTEEFGKSDWIVYDKDRKEIGRISKRLNEKDAMAVLHFSRPFELNAFNRGVEFQKQKNPKTIKDLQAMVTNFEADRKVMVARNLELANELEKLNKQLDELTIKK